MTVPKVIFACGIGFLALGAVNVFSSSNPGSRGGTNSQLPEKALKQQTPKTDPAKLLEAAQNEGFHSGIILRFSCQIPYESKYYEHAMKERDRAERLWDKNIIREIRLEEAKKLQTLAFSHGLKIYATSIEGKVPTLQLKSDSFDETSAFQDDGLSKSLENVLPGLGFQRVSYVSRFNQGSHVTFNPDAVHQAEFGKIESLCEEVRQGAIEASAINDTVPNPK